ncbi:hypothetical protein BDV25DRAFT_136795 [Aspergillus avenaceus]|uniref:Rhodopsin domain-containing protein n=1 Tax=Aspergillus avenaceus TaxID=36643 RepID=A0A5N6U4J6_ASPAV|nr:hypothetical protein BDV25DRAFT_136795 [Aspergillus avenaceus]
MSMSGDQAEPPLLNHGPGAWVTTVSIILLAVAILATAVALISRFRTLHFLTLSDGILAAATLLFIAQTSCICVASQHGIGKHREDLSDAALISYAKSLYAGELLAVTVLACSKAAINVLLMAIGPFDSVLIASKALLAMTSAWTITSIISLAFQCSLPSPWDSTLSRCINKEALYIALFICHATLDIALVILPIVMTRRVQMPGQKRFQIAALFGLRVVSPALTIPFLISLRPLRSTQDQPRHMVMPIIWLQLLQCASIVCTCIPSMKRALADLQTGMMSGAISEWFELSVSGQQHSGPTASASASSRRAPSGLTGSGLSSEVDKGALSRRERCRRPGQVESRESMRNLRDDAIVRTVDFELCYEVSRGIGDVVRGIE